MGYMGCKGEITFMILIPPQEYLSPTIARTPCRLSGDVRPGAEICGQGPWALGFLGLEESAAMKVWGRRIAVMVYYSKELPSFGFRSVQLNMT